jgi:serine/threonine protein phosphatase PrpC
MAEATPRSPDVGAVLTITYMTWPRLHVIHVGTCRCHLQRGGVLELIPTDHTPAQQLVESGVLPAHESATSRLSRVLMSLKHAWLPLSRGESNGAAFLAHLFLAQRLCNGLSL